MIAWGIIWVILLAIITLLILQEIINGTIEIRFWIIVLLIFALILVPICTIGRYNQSKQYRKMGNICTLLLWYQRPRTNSTTIL